MKANSLKRLVIAGAIILLAGGAGYAQEQAPVAPNHDQKEMRGPGHKMMHPDMDKCDAPRHNMDMFPNITDAQKKQIAELRTKHLEAIIPIKNQLNEKKAHLQTLLTSATVDNKEVDKVVNDISALETSKLKEAINHDQQIRAILTPEQRVAFDSKPKPFLHDDEGMVRGKHGKK